MRKDVRLGLAVGTLLFVLVMAYVLFFTGGHSAKNAANAQANAAPRVLPSLAEQTAQTPAQTPASNQQSPAGEEHASLTQPPVAHDPPLPDSNNSSGNELNHESQNIITPSTPSTLTAGESSPPSGDPPAVADANHDDAPPILAGGMTTAQKTWQELLQNGAPDAAHSATPSTTTPPAPPVSDNHSTNPENPTPPGDPHLQDPPIISPPATRPSTGSREYKVKPGDSFWSIAKAEYGNPAYFSHIVRANPNVNPARLKAGMTIVLPEKGDVIPGPSIALVNHGPTTRPIDASREYRVQSGDNLNTIAKRLYGSTAKAKEIYDLNKDLIGPNPNALKLHMVLKLPEAPAAAASSTISQTPPQD